MKSPLATSDCLLLTLQWVARLLSLAVLAMVTLMLIGGGGFNPLAMTFSESVLMVSFWTAMVGLGVAWRWENVGGALNVGGIVLFYALHWGLTASFPKGWVFPCLALPGVLFLIIGR
jgi:hypothetical protein